MKLEPSLIAYPPALAPSGVITLTTDFGLSDPYVGVMKGVILRRAPKASVIDLTHGIPPQDLRACAYWVARYVPWFPDGTVHVVVVDPTVGTQRRVLVIRAFQQLFVVPDNGIVGAELTAAPDFAARTVDSVALGVPAVSRTFHGRDLFAPVAAGLSSGRLAWYAVGPEAGELSPPVLTPATRTARGAAVEINGSVVLADRFGNLLTNIAKSSLEGLRGLRVHVLDTELGMVETYAQGASGEAVALLNSSDCVEIAVNCGSAVQRFGLSESVIRSGVAVRVLGNG